MKLLLLAITFSLFSIANIGDTIAHSLKYMGSAGSYTQTVKSMSPDQQKYLVQTQTKIAGQTQVQVNEVLVDDLFTKQKAQEVLTYCSQIGGTTERVNGITTCKVSNNALNIAGLGYMIEGLNINTAWIGSVPVNGIVKAVLANGLTLNFQNGSWAKK